MDGWEERETFHGKIDGMAARTLYTGGAANVHEESVAAAAQKLGHFRACHEKRLKSTSLFAIEFLSLGVTWRGDGSDGIADGAAYRGGAHWVHEEISASRADQLALTTCRERKSFTYPIKTKMRKE